MEDRARLDRILREEEGEKLLSSLHEMEADGSLFRLFPALQKGKGLLQRPEYHAYDVLEHNLRCCSAAPPIFPLRLAALLHDIGKPFINRADGHMYGHDVLGAKMAEEALRRLHYEEELIGLVTALVKEHMFDLKMEAKDKTVRGRLLQFGEDYGADFPELFILLREADVYGSGRTPKHIPVETAERFKRILKALREGKKK